MNRNFDDELRDATAARLTMAINIAEEFNHSRRDRYAEGVIAPALSTGDVLLAMLGASIEEAQGHFMERFPINE